MSLAAGALSQTSVSQDKAVLVSAAATGGTGPYTYQWYRSTTSGFSPGGGNILAGKTALNLTDTGLIPNTAYYYVVVVTDTGNSNVTANSAQLSVQTSVPQPNISAFAQSPQLGMVDLRVGPTNTISVQIDASQATPLYAGSPVKMVDSADGVPKVVGCSATSDEVLGYINYDIKSVSFLAGAAAEISMAGSCMYLYSTAAIARGVKVVLQLTTNGGVAAASGSGGEDIVGWAFDKASAAGQLIRVMLLTPSFLKDA